MRVFPDGRKAVVLGQLLGTGQPPGDRILLIDLVSGGVRILKGPQFAFAMAVTRDGKSVLAESRSGDLAAVQSLAATGQTPPRTLFITTTPMYNLDSGPDGSVYADQVDRPNALVRFSASGGRIQRLSGFARFGSAGALLPDGRVLRAGTWQLVVLEEGKEPVPLVNTSDQTMSPATALGSSEVAFIIVSPTPTPHRELAVAAISTGTILRRIAFDKGGITSLAATPDGKTLFLAAGGSIWSLPATGGEPKRIRPGDSVGVDPTGKYLLVQVIEHPKTRLVRVPLDGGGEQEIPLTGPYHLTFEPIGTEMIGKDGRLVVPLASPDSWFFSPGIVDLATGRMTRIPVDHYYDYFSMAWNPDGQVVATAMGLKSALWKFQPEGR